MTKQRISLQQSLFRNLAIGPLILGVSLLSISVFAERQLKRIIAVELTGRTISEVESAFIDYLKPVSEGMELSVQLGQSGRLGSSSTEELDTIFSSMLETFDQISSVHLAQKSGQSYMLLENADGSYFSRLFAPDKPGQIITRKWPAKPNQAQVLVNQEASNYDPRKRVWFQKALSVFNQENESQSKNQPVWSDPYTFFTTKDKGITASTAYETPSGNIEVLAFDILLNDILEFVEKTKVRTSGIVFVILRHSDTGSLDVLAVPSERFKNPNIKLPTDFPIPISQLVGAPRVFVEKNFTTGVPPEGQPFRFNLDGAAWWGTTARMNLSNRKEIWISSTIPESDVLEGIPNISLFTLIALLLTLCIMTIRARRLSQRYGHPISELVAETERIGRLNFTQQTTIESSIYEVQVLASSQASMRRSLGALTAMNDRKSIAQELRVVPDSMREKKTGPWEISLFDKPADKVGGCFPMTFFAHVNPQGCYFLAEDDALNAGVFIVLITTQLNGMQAAQNAASLRAIVRALLQQGVMLEEILEAITTELIQGVRTSAPSSVLIGFVNGFHNTLEVSFNGRASVLVWHGNCMSAEWIVHSEDQSAKVPAKRTIELDEDNKVVIVPDCLFDILSQDRTHLQFSDLEKWFAAFYEEPASTIVQNLGQAISNFADTEILDTDVAIFAISKNLSAMSSQN